MWHYEGHHFWGMHWFWWIIWIVLIIWIFATPWDIPGNRKTKEKAMEILDRKLAEGEISIEEYEEKRELILNKKK